MMNTSDKRKIWWVITLTYIIFIYSTLRVAPIIWDKLGLQSRLGGGGMYRLYGVIFLCALIYIIRRYKASNFRKYIVFCILIFAVFFLLKRTRFPAQKIHLVEYGILGVFLYNLFKTYFDRFNIRLYISAGIIAAIAGVLDECIQWILPDRVFSPWDILMNFSGAFITLLFIRYVLISGAES